MATDPTAPHVCSGEEKKTFSIAVIVPAFNVSAYIEDAIDSVLVQSIKPNEIIIVNDGSTDNTRQLISKYESNPIVRIIDQENKGLGPARNRGLEAANSEYVYFFDSDDLLVSDFVETIFNVVAEYGHPELIAFSGVSFFDKGYSSNFFPNYKRYVEGQYNSGADLYRALSISKCLYSSACLQVTKKSIWSENCLRFKPIVHEDEEILLPLYFSAGQSVCISKALFKRRVRPGSIMTGGRSERNINGDMETLRSLIKYKENFPDKIKGFDELWENRLELFLYRIITLSLTVRHVQPMDDLLHTLGAVKSIKMRALLLLMKLPTSIQRQLFYLTRNFYRLVKGINSAIWRRG